MANILMHYNAETNEYEEVNTTAHVPKASATTLGGIKLGDNLTMEEDGTVNAEAGGTGIFYEDSNGEMQEAQELEINNITVAEDNGFTASDTYYDNTNSGLNAENVQDAIDEVATVRKFPREIISGWTVNKWSDGTCECYKTVNLTTTMATADGSIYTSATMLGAQSFPTSLFIETPNYFCASPSGSGTLGVCGVIYGSAVLTKDLTPSIGLWRQNSRSASASYPIHILAKGKWR